MFDKLVNAKSVAVVGASENPMKIGYAILFPRLMNADIPIPSSDIESIVNRPSAPL